MDQLDIISSTDLPHKLFSLGGLISGWDKKSGESLPDCLVLNDSKIFALAGL